MSSEGTVHDLRTSRPSAPGGNGTGGSDDRLREVEKKLAVIESEIRHLATKADIEEKFASQNKWLIGVLIKVVLGLGTMFLGLGLAILRWG